MTFLRRSSLKVNHVHNLLKLNLMNYVLKGSLFAWICKECREPLSNMKVRIYDVKESPSLTRLVAANEKDTLYVVPAGAEKERQKLLLAEVSTDKNGNFTAKLSDKNYDGRAIEIAVYAESVPGQKKGKKSPKPVEFVITTFQPSWRETNDGLMAMWEYILPYRFWCYILSLFDVWVICGKIVTCTDQQTPIIGVTVTAYDADWITDDKLGSAITNNTGHFKIYYTSKDFKQTFLSPIINVETPFPPYNSGPDVYFKVESSGGTLLINETREDGRKPERSNIGNCFCITLCVKGIPDDEDDYMPSAWTGIGTHFTIPDGSGLNDFDADGYAGTMKYAFTGVIRTTGQSDIKKDGHPLEYRFLVSKTTSVNGGPLLPAANFTMVVGKDPGLFVETKIGQMWQFTPIFKTVDIYAKQADFDSDGWLDVNKSILRTFTDDPSLNPVELSIPGKWNWVDLDGMIAINTNALTTEANVPLSAADPGQPVPAGDKIAIEKIAIRFELREVIDKPNGVFNYLPGSGQTLNSMVVNNNPAFMKVAIKEHLSSTACTPLSGNVHVVYTAYHPHLENVSVTVKKNGTSSEVGLSDANIPLTNNTNVSLDQVNNNSGILVNSFLTLTKCTYIVKLLVKRRLHNGDGTVSTALEDTSFYYE